jgi:RNA polymerase sigma-70 factor, ECF subfamily
MMTAQTATCPALDPMAEAVAEALASLEKDHREVLVETYYRRHSVAEAAAALGIPAATVKSRTFYALKQLSLALHQRRHIL